MVKYVISYSTYTVREVDIEGTWGAFSYAKDDSGTTEGFLTVELYDSKEEAYRKSLEMMQKKIEVIRSQIETDLITIQNLCKSIQVNSFDYASCKQDNIQE